jgi:thiol-disulfide isomerase/thioredoxin
MNAVRLCSNPSLLFRCSLLFQRSCLFQLATGTLAFAAMLLPLAVPVCALGQASGQVMATDPAVAASPRYAEAMAEAKQMTKKREYTFAADAYKKASKVAGGKDWASLNGLYLTQITMGSFKDAVGTAKAMEAIAVGPVAKSSVETDEGRALYLQAGDKGKVELLQAADAAFKAALAADAKNGTAHYFDGTVLARLKQMDAAGEQFKECLSCISPKDPSYTRAEHFAENPALSTAKMAPPFTVTALDGTKFNLDEMGGRVVLIDFWATWCGPCNAELPHMKKIAKEFAGEPLVIISVSWDSDDSKWRNFIEKNEMTWVQYRDADHSLSNRFEINAIPHYFTIDSDGVLTAEMLGSGSDVEGKLKKLVARAKAAQAAKVAEETPPSGASSLCAANP